MVILKGTVDGLVAMYGKNIVTDVVGFDDMGNALVIDCKRGQLVAAVTTKGFKSLGFKVPEDTEFNTIPFGKEK